MDAEKKDAPQLPINVDPPGTNPTGASDMPDGKGAAPPSTALAKSKGLPEHADAFFSGKDRIYAEPLAAAGQNDRSKGWLWTAGLILTAVIVLLVWTRYADLEEVAMGTARVIPSSREQIIQSLEGGILQELLVREGMEVQKGTPLLRIDPTRASSSFQEGRNRWLGLMASATRLRAESQGKTTLVFPPELKDSPELMESERSTFNARQYSVNQSIAGLRQSAVLMRQELAILEPMVTKGLASEVEAIRLRRQINELETQSAERLNRSRAEAGTELVKVESELAQVGENLSARQDQVDRTVIRAPLRGTVKNIRVTTRGGIIQPAQDIMEIVPLEDTLLIEAKIKPSEVAFIRPGLPANIKITAYDSGVYGSLKGRVEFISPDTLREEQRRADEDTYYRVLIRTDTAVLHYRGRELPVLPGMTGSVDIMTGHRTVADYLLKPVLRLKDAFKEK